MFELHWYPSISVVMGTLFNSQPRSIVNYDQLVDNVEGGEDKDITLQQEIATLTIINLL